MLIEMSFVIILGFRVILLDSRTGLGRHPWNVIDKNRAYFNVLVIESILMRIFLGDFVT